MTGLLRFLNYWLPVLGLAAIIFFQSSYPSPDRLPHWPHLDKVVHAGVYGFLSLLICRALDSLPRWRGRTRLLLAVATLLATLYGVTDEWHQAHVPYRSCDPADVLADFMGSFVGAFVYLRILSRLKRNRTPAV